MFNRFGPSLLIVSVLIVSGTITGCQKREPVPAKQVTVKSPPKEPEVQWIDPNKIQPGPIRHDSLTPEQMERLQKLQAIFAEVDSRPLEKWVENFKRDLNPDSELGIWEKMAKAYTAYCSKHQLSPEAKKEVYRVVLLRSMAAEKDVLERLELKVLTKDEAVEVMSGY